MPHTAAASSSRPNGNPVVVYTSSPVQPRTRPGKRSRAMLFKGRELTMLLRPPPRAFSCPIELSEMTYIIRSNSLMLGALLMLPCTFSISSVDPSI